MKREGRLNIGLSYYQEECWLVAIKLHGSSIMVKSLLSRGQKAELLNEYHKRSQ